MLNQQNMKQKNRKTQPRKNAAYKTARKVRSYADDPLVIQKGLESKEFLDRVGFPDPSLYKK